MAALCGYRKLVEVQALSVVRGQEPCGRAALYELVEYDPQTDAYAVHGFRCNRHREPAHAHGACYRLGVQHCETAIGKYGRPCTHKALFVVTRKMTGLRSIACKRHQPKPNQVDEGRFSVERMRA